MPRSRGSLSRDLTPHGAAAVAQRRLQRQMSDTLGPGEAVPVGGASRGSAAWVSARLEWASLAQVEARDQPGNQR